MPIPRFVKLSLVTDDDENRSIYSAGDYVSICVYGSEPIIGFKWIREESGKLYEDDDLSVDGGLTPEQALQVVNELKAAIEFAKTL